MHFFFATLVLLSFSPYSQADSRVYSAQVFLVKPETAKYSAKDKCIKVERVLPPKGSYPSHITISPYLRIECFKSPLWKTNYLRLRLESEKNLKGSLVTELASEKVSSAESCEIRLKDMLAELERGSSIIAEKRLTNGKYAILVESSFSF